MSRLTTLSITYRGHRDTFSDIYTKIEYLWKKRKKYGGLCLCGYYSVQGYKKGQERGVSNRMVYGLLSWLVLVPFV